MAGRGSRFAGAVIAAAIAVVVGAGPALAAPAAGGGGLTPAERQLEPFVAQLELEYQQVEAATEKYDGLNEKLTAARKLDAGLQRQLKDLRGRVQVGRMLAAGLVDAQYRNQNVSKLGELILSREPYQAANLDAMLASAVRSQGALLKKLQQDERKLSADTARADANLARARKLAEQAQKQKAVVQNQLAVTEQSLAGWPGVQLEDIKRLEEIQANAAQLAFLASGALGKGGGNPSALGRSALNYAFDQLGKPYQWGGNGPKSYDCSGLTQQSWLSAGLQIPRTSQEQWASLKHVRLNQLRPGDLIIYFPGATHVAMYIGDGKVVEAPHTGAYVEVAPIATDPVLGAVRPDPAAHGLSSYHRPSEHSKDKGSQGGSN
jgi:cell wall-associated NlpC family hydrolase